MPQKRDIIIGYASGYDWSTISTWANSIDAVEFEGHKVMLIGDATEETVEKLQEHKFSIIAQGGNAYGKYLADPNYHPVVLRFFISWHLLQGILRAEHYRYVIMTDVKDVIFQTNPSKYLEGKINTASNKKILIGSESLKYCDEPWGNNNLQASFPFLPIYEMMKNQVIGNAGTMAGDAEYMRDFFLNVFLTSIGKQIHNPDQAVVNLLLHLKPFSDIVRIVTAEDAWACQAGTTVDPLKIDDFRTFLLDPEPVMKDDGYVYTQGGLKFCLVHQYDRVPKWKEIIEKRHKEMQ